jgi:hypothetical protein
MSIPLEHEGVQSGLSSERRREAFRNSGQIYTKRKDVLGIKARLLELVPDEDYWTTLALYIHGECPKSRFDEAMDLYLTTNRARILHNEFIRSIVFNAHFSCVAPPNISLPARRLPDHVAAQRHRLPPTRLPSFASFCAADLGHLPSAEQLSRRMSALIGGKNLRIDPATVPILFTTLKQYLILLLQNSLELVVRNCDAGQAVVVRPVHIGYALRANLSISSVVSPELFAKFPG